MLPLERPSVALQRRGVCGLPTIIERLNRETVHVLNLPEVKSQLAAQSIDPFPGTSEQFRELIEQDTKKWAKVIRTADVRID